MTTATSEKAPDAGATAMPGADQNPTIKKESDMSTVPKITNETEIVAVEEWEEFAAAYLEKHPEISAAVPDWAEELEFSEIGDDNEPSEFHFTRAVGMVTLWGNGIRDADGVVRITDDGAPDILIDQRGEICTASIAEASDIALTLSVNLQNVVSILTASRRTLRRPAAVDDRLRALDD